MLPQLISLRQTAPRYAEIRGFGHPGKRANQFFPDDVAACRPGLNDTQQIIARTSAMPVCKCIGIVDDPVIVHADQ
jgi:hypothetical protein